MIYLIVFLILLFLSFYYDINQKREHRDFWYYTVLLILILIAGLRYRIGADTTYYLYNFYHEYPDLSQFSFNEYYIGKDPGYVLLNSIVKSLGGKFYVVQLIHAAFINVLIFKYIRKHCTFIFTAIFFYYIYFYISYNMEIMRASMSIVICLYANDYIIEKKWVKGYLLYFFAILFHSQAIVFLLLPFMCFVRLNKWGCIILICAFLLGYIMQSLLGDYLFLLDENEHMQEKAESYINSEYFGERNKSIGYIVLRILVPASLAIISLIYIKRHFIYDDILKLEPFVMLGLFFMMIQLNFQISYRYVDYFRVYIVIFYSELLVGLSTNQLRTKKLINYFIALLIFFPLFYMVGVKYHSWSHRYYPYNSVFDRKFDSNREMKYTELTNTRSSAIDEY